MSGNINKRNLQKLRSLYRRYAPEDLYYKIKEKLAAPYQDYGQTYQSFLPTAEELRDQRARSFPYAPLVSIVVPAFETDEIFLRQMIDSVAAQTYPNWELCVADGSSSEKVRQAIARHYSAEPRVKYRKLERNAGISENTNQGFAMAEGEYIGLLDHDDLLVPSALYEMVKRINDTGADMLYSDEDKVSADLTQYMEPHFKLDFNRELLLGNNYICHFLVVSRRVLKAAGGLDSSYNGAQDFDFALRCSEVAERIEHIPKILYHWRMHSGSTAGNTDSKPYAYEAGKRAVEAALARNGQKGVVIMSQDLGFYRTAYEIPKGITVGVCCWQGPAQAGLWEKSVEPAASFERETGRIALKWKNIINRELSGCQAEIIWDYNVTHKSPQADFVLLLNTSAKAILPGSVRQLLGSCARPGVGLAGSKVIAGGRVLQCGFWRKEADAWTPRFRNLPRQFKGYFRRAYLSAEVDAVSPDLAILSKSALESLEKSQLGKEAQRNKPEGREGVFSLAGWPDICSRLKESGCKIIVVPASQVTLRRGRKISNIANFSI